MKRSTWFIFALALAACDSKKESAGESAAPQVRRTSRADHPATSSSTLLPPLLKTPRITVSATGTGFSHPIIQDAAQADAILTDVRTLPPSAGRDRVTGGILTSLAKVDPEAARSRLLEWRDGLISHWLDAAKAVAEQLGKSDPEAAARFIEESVPRASQAAVWRNFLTALPPEARVPFLHRVPEGVLKHAITTDLLAAWLETNPQACTAWFEEFTTGWSGDEFKDLNTPLWNATASKKGAEPWLTAYHAASATETRRLFANAAWSHADAAGRATLLPVLQEVLPDLLDREWEEVVRINPAAYANALTTAQIAAFSSEDMGKLISSWSRTSPQAALDWALLHQRPEAAQAIVPLYYQEPKSALALASKLPPGKPRDQAISSLCQSIAHDRDKPSAESLLPLITDPAFREQTRKAIHGQWD